MAKQTIFLRAFTNKARNSIIVFSEFPNLPMIKLHAKLDDVIMPQRDIEIDFNFDGKVYLDVVKELYQPLIGTFVAQSLVTNRSYKADSFTDFNHQDTLDDSFDDKTFFNKDFDLEITNELTEFFETTKNRKYTLKSMPKNKKFIDGTVGDYVFKNLGFTIADLVLNIPNILDTNQSFQTAWDHPTIKANPNKFKPKVDPDLVNVIKAESQEMTYILDSISKINPAQPNKNYLLIGKPAIGKSETARAIAHLLNLPYAEYTFTKTTEFADSVGKITATMIDQTDKSWAFLPTEVFAVMEAGGIVNFEEVAAMLESHQVEGNNVISGLNRYLYAAGHKVVVNDKTIFFGTTNAGLGGLSKMQAAFLSRWDQVEFTAPSPKTITKYYLKKYAGKLDPIVIESLVDLTFGVGDVLSNTEQFLRDDPHWGPAPNVNNRNRTHLIFMILSYPGMSISKIVEKFIRSQIHTSYFSEEVIDKVLVECQNPIGIFENRVKEHYNPSVKISNIGFTFASQSKKTAAPAYEVEL